MLHDAFTVKLRTYMDILGVVHNDSINFFTGGGGVLMLKYTYFKMLIIDSWSKFKSMLWEGVERKQDV
jgi:hypothetical protein